MSEYLTRKATPVATMLAQTYGLTLDSTGMAMLARRLATRLRVSSRTAGESRSPIPALRRAVTHTAALLKYAAAPPARHQSIVLRSRKLASALRANALVGFELVAAAPPFNPSRLLLDLDNARPRPRDLRALMRTLDAIKPRKRKWTVGRPIAFYRPIVWCGCTLWRLGGRRMQCRWDVIADELSGELADFLRGLLACCRDQTGAPLPSVTDVALRDAVYAYRDWWRENGRKIRSFPLDPSEGLI